MRLRCALFALALGGCGPVTYAFDVAAAERVVGEARTNNASYHAPYELSFAEAHLEKAKEEASHGAYEDAIGLAGVAQVYGQRALDLSRRPSLHP